MVTGKVLEFTGPGLEELPLDERATLANMAVEAGALTGIVTPDGGVLEEVARLRGADLATLRAQIGKKTIRAPFAGKTGIRAVNVGQYLARGIDRILTVIPHNQGSAEHSHETVAEKLVHNAVLPVDDLDRFAPESIEVIDYRIR